MKKLIFIALLLNISVITYAQDDKTVTLVVSGQGKSQDEAKTNALSSAIKQAFGVFISSKIVKGRKISGYYSLEDDVNNAGAIYSRDPVVVDKNIISSPHYDFMGEWMEEALVQHKKWKQ
jgi:putative intracellular protease/amidase